MRTLNSRSLLFATALLGLAAPAAHGADEEGLLVLTALAPLYSVSKALTTGTGIEVRNVPEGGRPLAAQQSFFESQAERLAPVFAEAAAVVSIGKLWAADPLYAAARAANIRVIDIDATKPWSTTLEGVSVALEPRDDSLWSDEPAAEVRQPSIYFWLSPANGAVMADIIARDLAALAPQDADRIAANLASYRRNLLALKREYELNLAELLDTTVYALTSELVYLTTDMGIYVDGYFLKQDIHWTPSDAEQFSAYLQDNDIGVVIHKWEPSELIRDAIARAGAELVVLDIGDTGPVEDGRLVDDGYLRLLRANLEALHEALRAAASD